MYCLSLFQEKFSSVTINDGVPQGFTVGPLLLHTLCEIPLFFLVSILISIYAEDTLVV